jgi:hypothetical protein
MVAAVAAVVDIRVDCQPSWGRSRPVTSFAQKILMCMTAKDTEVNTIDEAEE